MANALDFGESAPIFVYAFGSFSKHIFVKEQINIQVDSHFRNSNKEQNALQKKHFASK